MFTPRKLPAARRRAARRGATLVETSLVLVTFLTFALGTLDLGLGALRYNSLSQAVRQAIRQAVVHGQLAAPSIGAWGPATVSGDGNSSHPLIATMRPFLPGFDLSTVNVQATWIDGDNDSTLGHRVRIVATATYRPLFTSFFGGQTHSFQASSEMAIVH